MMQTASNLPSRSARQAYDYVLAEGSPEYYREFIELYPHDPLSDRLRGLLGSLLQAAAWHNAVLANSPLGYKSFYDNYGNSPYAQAALKLQSQPKTVPLFQPTQLIVPPQLKQTIKLTNLGSPKDNLGTSLGQAGPQVHGGNLSTGISQGNLGVALGDKIDSGKNIGGKADTGQIVHLPSGVMPMQPSTETPSSDPKKIVTLPASGTNVTTSPNGGVAGKIVTLPVGTLGKGGSNQDSKMNGSSKPCGRSSGQQAAAILCGQARDGRAKAQRQPVAREPAAEQYPDRQDQQQYKRQFECALCHDGAIPRSPRAIERPGPGTRRVHALIAHPDVLRTADRWRGWFRNPAAPNADNASTAGLPAFNRTRSARRQLLQAQRHRRVGIGQRGDRRKMVGVGYRCKPCRNPGYTPGIDNGPALPEIFRAFIAPHHGVEAAMHRRLPEQRARRHRRCIVEFECVVDRCFGQWTKVEQARNGVGRAHKPIRQRRIECAPVGRQHACRKMAAGGVTADDERPPQPRQLPRRHFHLPDNVVDGNIGAKIVARYGDVDAMGVQPTGQMAEGRTIERLPVATVNKNDDRAALSPGKKSIWLRAPGP